MLTKKRFLELLNKYSKETNSFEKTYVSAPIEVDLLKQLPENPAFKALPENASLDLAAFQCMTGNSQVPTKEYLSSSDVGTRIYRELMAEFKNTKTFLSKKDIYTISPENFIELDGYAFNVLEIVACLSKKRPGFSFNPHLNSSFKFPFSRDAIEKMHLHPILSAYMQNLTPPSIETQFFFATVKSDQHGTTILTSVWPAKLHL